MMQENYQRFQISTALFSKNISEVLKRPFLIARSFPSPAKDRLLFKYKICFSYAEKGAHFLEFETSLEKINRSWSLNVFRSRTSGIKKNKFSSSDVLLKNCTLMHKIDN